MEHQDPGWAVTSDLMDFHFHAKLSEVECFLLDSPQQFDAGDTDDLAHPALGPIGGDSTGLHPLVQNPVGGVGVWAGGGGGQVYSQDGLSPIDGSSGGGSAGAAAMRPFHASGYVPGLLNIDQQAWVLARGIRDRYRRLNEEERLEFQDEQAQLAHLPPWELKERLEFVDKQPQLPQLFPWELNSSSLLAMSMSSSSNYTTEGNGCWKKKPNSAIAVRGSPGEPQQYVAAMETYEFNGAKTDEKWLMKEYKLLDPHDSLPGLVIDDSLVFRRVFCEEQDTSVFRRVFCKEQECKVSESASKGPVNSDESQDVAAQDYHLLPSGKRKRSVKRQRRSGADGESEARRREESKVWQHYTKLYDQNGEQVKAICNDCYRIYAAKTPNGTTRLHNHQREKHQQPIQAQAKETSWEGEASTPYASCS